MKFGTMYTVFVTSTVMAADTIIERLEEFSLGCDGETPAADTVLAGCDHMSPSFLCGVEALSMACNITDGKNRLVLRPPYDNLAEYETLVASGEIDRVLRSCVSLGLTMSGESFPTEVFRRMPNLRELDISFEGRSYLFPTVEDIKLLGRSVKKLIIRKVKVGQKLFQEVLNMPELLQFKADSVEVGLEEGEPFTFEFNESALDRLKALDLAGCTMGYHYHLGAQLCRLRKIELLNISNKWGNKVWQHFEDGATWPELRILIARKAEVTNEILEKLMRLSSLESLDVGDNEIFDRYELDEDGEATMFRSENLHLDQSKGRLSSLRLSKCRISSSILEQIFACESLDKLCFHECPDLVQTIAGMEDLGALGRMKKLMLYNVGLDAPIFGKICTSLGSLTHLYVCYNPKIGEIESEFNFGSLPDTLKRLYLPGCNVNPRLFMLICKQFRRVDVLDLSENIAFGAALAEGRTRREYVTISESGQLLVDGSPFGFYNLVSTLVVLGLNNAGISSHQILDAITELENLEWLSLSNNVCFGQDFPDDMGETKIGNLTKLRYLNIANTGVSPFLKHDLFRMFPDAKLVMYGSN